jgi:Methylase involved in ubiquinone/menaquinone biosynthesis
VCASTCMHYIHDTMSNKNMTTIHEFDFNFVCDFFSNTHRQGPGSPEATLKALSFVDNLTDQSVIADIGCGTGGQAMVLGKHAPGKIIGIDLFPPFVDLFNANALKMNLGDRVKGIVGSMENLPFGNEELDLIWSEGAIYNIGFERGLNEWRKHLKTGGYIAVSESSWFTERRPAEIENYWMKHYPEIDTIPRKIAQIRQAGYTPVSALILPENCWTEHYFAPMERAEKIFLDKHAGDEAAEKFVAFQRHDVELYRKYKAFYGYVFYIAKKRDQ